VLYQLFTVEFDDKGIFRNRNQLDAVIDGINQYKENVDFVLYVHGWQHNVASDDENLKNFQKILHKLAARNKSRHIVGVFVGWRGETLNVPYIKNLSFWDRKNTSIEVGRGAVYELLELLRLARGKFNNSRLITIGHSFGASVLLSVSKNEVYRDLVPNRDSPEKPWDVLTILINPAIEAIHFLPLYELPEEKARIDSSIYHFAQVPRIAVFTSETDWATKYAFKAGRFFSTLFESHKTIVRKNRNNKDLVLSESQMDIETIGHFKPFVTHELIVTSSGSKEPTTCDALPQSWQGGLLDQTRDERWVGRFKESGTSLAHLGNSPAFSPVWVVRVASDIIPDHGAIWGDRFNCFLEELVLMR
jgi:hypothetical protein